MNKALSDDAEWMAARAGQARAAEPTANAWVAANAGSGKTKVLIDRVARLLLAGAAPDSILCVTYTKAAASEMQDRLFRRLGDWCVADDRRLRADLVELEGGGKIPDDKLPEARQLFARALETPGGLRIETIHAFCGRLLRRFPLEAGAAPGFQELNEADTEELWALAFHHLGARVAMGGPDLVKAARTVAEAGGAGFEVLRKLDEHRREVHAFMTAPGGVEAGLERLRKELGAPEAAVDQIVDEAMGRGLPRKILSELAAVRPSRENEDARRVDALRVALSDAPAEYRFETYATLAFTDNGVLRRRNSYTAEAARADPRLVELFQIVDAPEGREIARIRQVAGQLAAARIFERSSSLVRLANPLFQDFARRKQGRAGLDFDDLIDRVARLLSRSHAAEWVLWKLDGGISHVLLDEAQDTSPAQWEILRALTDEIFAGAGVERESTRTLFVVGDQKQSIYSFQGADPEHFLDQAREVQKMAQDAAAPFNTPSLAMSFRSAPEVLRFVDEVFDRARFGDGGPFSMQVSTAHHAPHAARRHGESGLVELWPIEPKDETSDPDPWDAPVDRVLETSPAVKLARQVASYIRREIDSGGAVWQDGKRRRARPGDFLILVKRRTGGIFDAMLQQLKLQNLPVAGADRIQLIESLPVQDMLNLVRFALCPEDDLALAEILKGPFGASGAPGALVFLNDDDLLALAYDRPGSLWSQVQASTSVKVAPVKAFLENLLTRGGDPPFEFLTHALECAHGLPCPGWELLAARFGQPAREPVTALIDRAAGFDAASPPSLELFLAAVEAAGGEVKRELSGPQDDVRVMTVHGAKGLQAPIVILPDTTAAPRGDLSGLFFTTEGAPVWVGAKAGDTPQTAAMRHESEERTLREHRRLLYVALTRAQDRLVVCGAWFGNGKAGRDKNSWYQLCENGMKRLIETDAGKPAPDDLLADLGPVMRLGEPAPKLAVGAESGTMATDLPAWIGKPAPVERAAPVLSPSRLTDGAGPPLASPFDANRAAGLRRGSLIHLMFEALPDIAAAERRSAAERFLSAQVDLSDDDRKDMLKAVFQVLEDKRFGPLFGPGGRPEAPIVGQFRNATLNGRVDRLVITPEEILIVDYKTDRPAPLDVSSVAEAYLAQMAAYREVLSQAWPNRLIRSFLVWTDGPHLMEIPNFLLENALKRVRA